MRRFLRSLVLTTAVVLCAALLWRALAPRTAMATALQSGRYQIAASGDGNAWIILDMNSGRFERWLVANDRYLVEAGQFGATGQTEARYVRGAVPR